MDHFGVALFQEGSIFGPLDGMDQLYSVHSSPGGLWPCAVGLWAGEFAADAAGVPSSQILDL